jgi:hypothetical protein
MAIDTTLRAEVADALRRGAGQSELLAIIRAFKARGGDQRAAYDTLEAVWKAQGFDADGGGDAGPIRDELEYVMEIVWGYCSREAAIWETSLTNE